MKCNIFFVFYLIFNQQLPTIFCIEYFYLKWFKNETKFPIVISHQASKPDSYLWYKHFEKKYVDKLALERESYATEINSNSGTNVLKILNFNFNTTEQLDHYRLRLKKQTINEEEDSFIYTLAYLKDFYILVQDYKYHLNATCFAKVSIPYGVNDDHQLWLGDRLQEVTLDFDLIDPNPPVTKRRRRSRETRRTSSFSRDVLDIEFYGVPIIQHKSGRAANFYNLKCKVSMSSYDNSIITESIYKYFEQSVPSIHTYASPSPPINQIYKAGNLGSRLCFKEFLLLFSSIIFNLYLQLIRKTSFL